MYLRKLLQVVLFGILLTMSLYAQTAQTAPTWARGTWYWVQGSDRTMVISNNGTIALSTGGTTTYGVYNGGKIYLNGNASTITKNGSQIRTINQTTNEVSDYAHAMAAVGQTSTPPAWMVGTWYWTQGPDRTIVIDTSGHVTLTSGGMTTPGTYYQHKINLNGNKSTVSEVGTNIRTVNQSTNEVSDYSRSPFNDGNENAQMEAPPSWALGSWASNVGPHTNLNIHSDGNVEITHVGNVNTVNARYYNGYINGGGLHLKLTKVDSNKIKTFNASNNKTVTYLKIGLIHTI
jgi:hypothetical protein